LQPADIADLVEASDPRVSPDGRTVAFVVTTVDLDANLYRSAVWVAGVDGASLPPCPFTGGSGRERMPRWSPDGEWLAFVAHPDPDSKGSALCVSAADGTGEETFELLSWPEDIDDLVWTADGSRLVFTARSRDEDQYGPSHDRDRPSRSIDRVSYRLDNVGWTIDRPRHVFSIASDGSSGGVPVRLTDGPYQDTGLAVSPDGAWVAFSSARTPTWDTDLSTHLYRVPIDGGAEPEQLTEGVHLHGSPSWSPDGSRLAFVWGDRHSMMKHGQIGVVSADGGGERLLTTALDLHCAPYLAAARDPVWVHGGHGLLFQVDEAGNVPLYRVVVEGGETALVVGGDRQVTGFDVAGGTLAFVATTAGDLPEVFALVDGEERRLTHLGSSFAAEHPIAEGPERFVAVSADGTEVEAWLLRPEGSTGDEKLPVLLAIHGGPFSQYGNRFFDEFHVLAGAGYAVLYSNPRGSSGYSSSFSRGIRGPRASEDPGTGWGGADYEDLMAVVDEALRRFPDLDASRLGVLGGSYGGYMTSWIIGHTDRFKAACSERALNNMLTFAHTSDIGAHFPAGYIGASHLDDPDEFVRQSPTTYFRDMTTPLLILHSDGDLRCPVEQAEDLFLRLKLTGREVEFHRFPGEGHELSRSGAPRHRVERLELILDWFGRKL
jgi:dipeptidyl aminopeptidase/acylaminoacyl peptidase